VLLGPRVGGEAALAPVDPGVRVVLIEVAHALHAPEAAGLEELRELAVGHLVAIELEVAHVGAVHGAFVQNAPASISMMPSARAAPGPGAGAGGPTRTSASAAPSAEPRRVHAVTRPR